MVRLCVSLLGRLNYEPKSMYRAKILGGPEHFGWGTTEYYLATLGDLLQVNTSVTASAGSKKRPRKIDPLYRPKVAREERAATLKDVNWSFFQ